MKKPMQCVTLGQKQNHYGDTTFLFGESLIKLFHNEIDKVQNTNTIIIRKQLETLNLRPDNIMSIILLTVFHILSNRQSCGGNDSNVLLQVGTLL